MPPENVECNASLYKQKKNCEKSKSRERIVGSWLTWGVNKTDQGYKRGIKRESAKRKKEKGKKKQMIDGFSLVSICMYVPYRK